MKRHQRLPQYKKKERQNCKLLHRIAILSPVVACSFYIGNFSQYPSEVIREIKGKGKSCNKNGYSYVGDPDPPLLHFGNFKERERRE